MLRERSVLLSAIIVITLVLMSIVAPTLVNPDDIYNWDNTLYWRLNPKNVPPEWFGRLTGLPKTEWLHGRAENGSYVFPYNFHYDTAPQDIIVMTDSFETYRVSIVSPDGEEYVLWDSPIPNELNLGKSGALIEIAHEKCSPDINAGDIIFKNALNAVFSKPKEDCITNPDTLKGTYAIVVTPKSGSSKMPKVYILGKSYGVMGTDNVGRDLWAGFLWGMRETIVISVVRAFVAIGLALVFGTLSVISSKLGVFFDLVSQIITVIPLLPAAIGLIIIASDIEDNTYAIFTDPLLLAIILGVLSVGEVSRNVRSMVEEELRKEYVESAKVVGGNALWILRKHISKVLVPYSLYQLALAVPGIIALITLLGFFNVVPGFNWGTLMSQSIRENTAYRVSWWHILPVGVALALLAIAFVSIARDIERRFLER